jgi:hypothetical protein
MLNFSLPSVGLELLTFFFLILLNKSNKTYLEHILPPGSMNWHLIKLIKSVQSFGSIAWSTCGHFLQRFEIPAIRLLLQKIDAYLESC